MTSTKNHYIPYLDGLRAFAIIFVILSHVGLDKIIPGGFGVSLFFFISGYLITKLLITEYEKTGTIGFKNFYLRRVFRLYPALILMVCLSIGALIILHGKIYPGAILSAFFYFTNYYIVYFKPLPVKEWDFIFDPTWSLSIEEHFYLLFPIIFFLFYNKKNNLLGFLLIACIIPLILRCYLTYTAPVIDDVFTNRIYVTTETRADSIIWGCIAALLLFKNNSEVYIKILKSYWSLIAGVVIILFSLLFRSEMFRESFRFSLQAIAFFLIVPSISFYKQTSFVKMVLENKVLVFIGRLSYSLYLFHWMVIILANNYFKQYSPVWIMFIVLGSLLLALASYYFVEQPFIALRRRFGSDAKV
jgi:peptidoglycan/LPS O-acetylase OafA/YrhL